MKKLLPALLLCLPMFCIGQVLSPTVISTTGGYDTTRGVSLSFTVGEAVTTTLQNPLAGPPSFYLTQGFQQPSTAKALNFYLNVLDESCLNSNDGAAYVTLSGGVPPFTIIWSSKPTLNSMNIDSLMPGSYTVTVKDGNGLTSSAPFTILANESACKVKIYSGFTPNGDGHNDTWIIDNINIYPDNSVEIYNRWGTEVWNGNGYDNSKVVFTGRDNQGQPLPDATYFYIVKISGAAPYKGWVQITR
jgi:gliding motility-associated-like protein